jgi:nitrate/nitrite transporter NarK
MLYLFAAIYGFARGAVSIVFPPITAKLFGLRSHGLIYGVVAAAGTFGGTISPVLTGHIFDITGSYQPAFIVYALVTVIGLILATLLRPTTSQDSI